MGLLSRLTGNNQQKGISSSTHYGGHSLTTDSIMNSLTDSVDPNSQINWQVSNPTVIREPRTASTEEANQAEVEAAAFKTAVSNGVRVFKAETQKQQDFAKLVGAQRRYLGATAQAHLQINQANAKLGKQLHGLRPLYAALGHGLDKAGATATHRINVLKAQLRGER
jgi:hypothetical protein